MNARRLRGVLIAALVLGYALLEHYSNRAAAPRLLGALLAISPPLLALALFARRAPHAWIVLPLCGLGVIAALAGLWPHLEHHFARIYLLQQCTLYLSLAIGFGRSLLRGHTPLCTRWASMVHGSLSDEAVRYTRAVTAAWTAFFITVVLLSATLYVTAPRMVWSAFSNFAVLPLAGTLFAAEYRLRLRQLPSMPRASLADTLRVYLADTRGARRF